MGLKVLGQDKLFQKLGRKASFYAHQALQLVIYSRVRLEDEESPVFFCFLVFIGQAVTAPGLSVVSSFFRGFWALELRRPHFMLTASLIPR